MTGKILRGIVSLILAFASVAASASAYTSISVFGDSLSDGGNDYLYTGGAFPPSPYAGLFGNGPVAVTQLAANLGLALTPSLAGGSNYAFGGAETGTLNYLRYSSSPALAAAFGGAPYPDTGVLAQIAGAPAGSITSSSLVVLWAGANDVFSSLASDPSGASIPTALGAALTNLQSAVGDLYAAGARTILMPNMPDLGQTPDFSGSPAAAQLTTAVATFDAGLTTLEMALEAALSGLDIIDFDTFGALNKLIANPAGYGLSNVTQPCFNGATVCGDPGSYLFWDGVHPTTAADAILAGLFTTAVLPEPPTTALVLLALIVVFASRQRRSL